MRRSLRREHQSVPLAFDAIGVCASHPHANISFAMSPGEILAFSAPEDVAAQVIRLAACDSLPASGEVRLFGRPTSSFKPRELVRMRIRMYSLVTAVPYLDGAMTVAQNLAYAMQLDGVRLDEADHHAREALDTVGLSKLCDRTPRELLLSESRWVGLLRALLSPGQVLLVEPGALGTDPSAIGAMLGVIREQFAGTGQAMLWADPSVRCCCMADRVLLYSRGTVYDADTDLPELGTFG